MDIGPAAALHVSPGLSCDIREDAYAEPLLFIVGRKLVRIDGVENGELIGMADTVIKLDGFRQMSVTPPAPPVSNEEITENS